jgi:hypothetical protein
MTTSASSYLAPIASSLAALSLCSLAALPGCKATVEVSIDVGPDPGDPDALTWWRDVEPIVRDKCVICHSPDNIAPFSLETHAQFVGAAPFAAVAIEAGIMPPWLADPSCREYTHPLALSPEQKQTLLSYIAGDMREGDPADAPKDVVDLRRELVPDVLVDMPTAYMPTQFPDDYRCFTMAWPEEYTEDMFVTGLEVYPGQRTMVHHVVVFAAAPELAHTYLDLDAADPEPGYECFGDPEAGVEAPPARWLGGWAPGMQPFFAPEGAGQRVRPGSTLIMQVHYNTSADQAREDRSSVALELSAAVERPAVLTPVTNPAWRAGDGSMLIPAGEARVTHEVAAGHDHTSIAPIKEELGLGPDDPLQIWSAIAHMHLFGNNALLQLRSIGEGEGDEECLLDIPRWDFNWQMNFGFATPAVFDVDQELLVRCTWDNSAENQPIINGEPAVPMDRNWGDGSLDEMCIGVFYLTPVD